MLDPLLNKFVSRVQAEVDALAHDTIKLNNRDKFDYNAGRYQGLLTALELLNELLQPDED